MPPQTDLVRRLGAVEVRARVEEHRLGRKVFVAVTTDDDRAAGSSWIVRPGWLEVARPMFVPDIVSPDEWAELVRELERWIR